MNSANTNTNRISLEREAKSANLLPPNYTLGEHEKGTQGKGHIVINVSLENGDDNNNIRRHTCQKQQTKIFLERYLMKTIYGHFYCGHELQYEIQSPSPSNSEKDGDDKSAEMNMYMENHNVAGNRVRGNAKAVKCVYVHNYDKIRNNHRGLRRDGGGDRPRPSRRHCSEDPDNEVAIKAHIEAKSSIDVAFDNHIILPQYVVTNRNQNREYQETQHHLQRQEEQQREEYYFIVSHLADGGDLIDKMMGMGMHTSKHLFRQTCKGVKYLHDLNIFHRDLKPDNIVIHSKLRFHSHQFLDDGDRDGQSQIYNPDGAGSTSTTTMPRTTQYNTETNTTLETANTCENENAFVIDFGQAQIIHDGADEIEKIGKYGTIIYTAPEFRLSHPNPYVNWRKADVWALGITLYIVLVKQFPPWTMSDRHNRPVLIDTANPLYQYICRKKKLYKYLQSNNIELSNDSNNNKNAVDLLQRMLLENVDQRISMRDILSHPWLRV